MEISSHFLPLTCRKNRPEPTKKAVSINWTYVINTTFYSEFIVSVCNYSGIHAVFRLPSQAAGHSADKPHGNDPAAAS